MPTYKATYLQDSNSAAMEYISDFHNYIMMFMISITFMTLFSLITTHLNPLTEKNMSSNNFLELVWTILPILTLIAIAAPSLKTLYILDDPEKPTLTLKTTGHQWYWTYEYSNFPFLDLTCYSDNSSESLPRLLNTDNSVILPSNTATKLMVTSSDVIHSWTIPALAVKSDAIPGRMNQVVFNPKRPGIFFGQCSEICGVNHSFMPIKLEVVPAKEFMNWVTTSSQQM